jgi:uncharacterized protein YbjT (DUF2867 family)
MKVLVYGAAGSQQFPVIASLLKKNATVYATTHQPKHADKLRQAGAHPVVADMSDRQRLMDINQGIDAVSLLVPFFLANPADGLRYAKNAIDAAVASKVKLIVWNTSGFILPHKIGNPAIDVRIDVLEYLRQSGVPSITIQPSVYAENLLGPWTAPFVANEKRVAYPTPVDMPVGWIATKDVAGFVAEALHRPEYAGEDFLVSGMENLTGADLADKFSIGLGEKVTYYALPPADFGKILDGLFGSGAGKGAEEMYQHITDTKQYPVMYSSVMDDVLSRLPVKMTAMEDWVAEFRNVFSKDA